MMRALLLAIVLAVAACSPETIDRAETQTPRPADVTPPASNTGMMNPTVPTQSDIESMQAGGATTADQGVHLIEYAIHMPQTLQAGKQSFQIENAGKEMHSFAIEGNGVQTRLPSNLSRGDSAHFEAQLPAGTYTVYCPVADHRQKGMHTQVTVK